MRQRQFPLCCGLQTLYDFPYDNWYRDETYGEDVSKAILKKIEYSKSKKYGAIIATTTPYTQSKATQDLIQCGFKVTHAYVSPKTKNTILMLRYDIAESIDEL